ncbi:MAG: golvesin C-terminal-like domain-containing protein [Planctomycetota bacterium]|jgi:hypothetical protein
MKDKLSVATLVLSAAALLVVLFSPTPKERGQAGGGKVDRIRRWVDAEAKAMDEDRAELTRMTRRAGTVGETSDQSEADKAEIAKLMGEMVAREADSRWRDFDRSLKTLALYEKTKPIAPKSLDGVVIDDAMARFTGRWIASKLNRPFVGVGYRHDDAAKDGRCRARFAARLPLAGKYEVRFFYAPFENRATKVRVTVRHADGTKTLAVNQRKALPNARTGYVLGTFSFTEDKDATVDVSNTRADGVVAVDAVQFVPVQ